jgi:hypothetical protein
MPSDEPPSPPSEKSNNRCESNVSYWRDSSVVAASPPRKLSEVTCQFPPIDQFFGYLRQIDRRWQRTTTVRPESKVISASFGLDICRVRIAALLDLGFMKFAERPGLCCVRVGIV